MRFKLTEAIDEREKYKGWAQEDIDLFESIDWDEQGDEDYDAGFAYLDSAVLYDTPEVVRAETEFHKFFKNDPYSQPYYKPIEKNPFDNEMTLKGPLPKGNTHRDYEVRNCYDSI